MKAAPLLLKLREPGPKITIVQGGGDAAKTVSIIQNISLELNEKRGAIATITDQTVPALRGGSMRAFQRYVAADFRPYIRKYNDSSRTYTFWNNATMEFKSFQDEDDARGSERDILFMNECNAQTYQTFWQLNRKTRIKTYLDYNPTTEFWVHAKLINGEEKQFEGKWRRFIVDHRHNPYLTPEEHASYESISDPDMFRVYSRGMTGKIRGLIFGHFKRSFDWGVRADYDRVIWGIDYGYTNDPTALVKIGIKGRKRVCQLLCYEPGVSAERLRDIFIFNDLQSQDVIYSEADPNMINQLRRLGLPVLPAIKGPGSIAAGISKVKEFECYAIGEEFWTEINFWKWVTAQDIMTGKEVMTNVPVDAWNHACDATRMAIYTDSFRHR